MNETCRTPTILAPPKLNFSNVGNIIIITTSNQKDTTSIRQHSLAKNKKHNIVQNKAYIITTKIKPERAV